MTDTVLPVYTVVVSPDNITLNENEAFSQTFIINATTEDTTAEPYDYVIDSIQISDTNLSKYVTISESTHTLCLDQSRISFDRMVCQNL